jgi:hypothetical protein
MKAKWHNFNLTNSAPARWECAADDCDSWGGNGGERRGTNARKSRASAREHTEETGHTTTVLTIEGCYADLGK